MELSLDLSLSFVPRTISEFLVDSKDGTQKNNAKLENLVKRLEDEKNKIEAFKRELPLTMILLNHATARLKEEINRCIKNENSDKKNWMSSVQLWNSETKSRSEEDDCYVSANEKEFSEVHSLSLMTPTFELKQRNSRSGCDGSYGSSSVIKGRSQPQQNSKKQRRCWSPELHRRFLDALQRLGGPQVATPKQIRELMQVEGLTNDEVKSHLQKYRLHCRKSPVSSVGKTNSNSGLWMAQDQKSKGSSSQSGSPHGPLSLRGSTKGLSSSERNTLELDTEEDEHSDCHNQITRT